MLWLEKKVWFILLALILILSIPLAPRLAGQGGPRPNPGPPEVDPVFTASPANVITDWDIINWDEIDWAEIINIPATLSFLENTIESAEITDGTIQANDMADGSTLEEISDDDGPGSGLDADLLDGMHAQEIMSGGGIPAGGIILWSGSIGAIPAGWQLCDGTNGTPDLRDRFIVGSGGSYSVGNTGGASTHSHGSGSYSASSHSHTVSSTGSASDRRWVDDNSGGTDHWVSGENHSHSFSTTSSGGGVIAGDSGSASSLPPHYALAYIMRL